MESKGIIGQFSLLSKNYLEVLEELLPRVPSMVLPLLRVDTTEIFQRVELVTKPTNIASLGADQGYEV